nr:hypothetical protein [Tanacetum cinerariifolium]
MVRRRAGAPPGGAHAAAHAGAGFSGARAGAAGALSAFWRAAHGPRPR